MDSLGGISVAKATALLSFFRKNQSKQSKKSFEVEKMSIFYGSLGLGV